MAKRSLASLNAGDLSGKRVLVRVDFNVPLNDAGAITDDTRIRAALPTINDLIGKGAKVILSAHFGRPKGQVNDAMRLTPVAARLSELLGKPVAKTDSCIGPDAEAKVGAMANGDVVLLENVRFFAEEEKNEAGFAEKLAGLAEVYVNDAFGAAHRAHASTEGVTKFLKPSVAGFLMEKELQYLQGAVDEPKRPLAAIVGGSKVSSKIGVLDSPDRQVRQGADRRRHDLHLLQGPRPLSGQEPGGRGQAGTGQGAGSQGQGQGRATAAAHRRGAGRQLRPRCQQPDR